MPIRAVWQKLQIFKIQNGGRPPFWKWLNRHISVRNRPILMNLGTLHQILNPMTVTWPKIEILKIQDDGGRHLKNRFFGHYSSINCPISATFCMRKQNGMSIRATGQKMQFFLNPRWRTTAIFKIVKSPYLSEKLSDFMKFGTLQQMLNPIAVTWPKIKSFKIQDGGDSHFENRFFGRFRRNFVRGSRTACRRRPHEKNCKFLKSKMADGRHF